ncbi:MAG: hypothetical protein ACKOBJ_05535 [Actinomycetota bacterium]
MPAKKSGTPALRTGEGIRRGGAQYEAIHNALAHGAALELADVGYGEFSPEGVAERVGVSAGVLQRCQLFGHAVCFGILDVERA